MNHNNNLLVSLCNLPAPGETAVLRLDTSSGEVFPLSLGATIPIKTCTGLTRDEALVYVLCADVDGKFYLAALDLEDLAPVFFQLLPEIRDGHSMVIHQNRLCIASTGNDAVIAYDLHQGGVGNPSLVWNVVDSNSDTHHVNGLAVWRGDLVLSAFGLKSGQTWSTALNGYLFNVSQGSMLAGNIYQPHSLKEWGDDLYYCESARGRIASLGKGVWQVGDYTRGLDFIGADTVVSGSSVARKVSKSTGLINNPADPGEAAGSCAVNIFHLSSATVADRLAHISLGNYAPEIYDLLYLGDPRNGENTFRMNDKILFRNDAPSAEAGQQMQRELLEQHQALSEVTRSLEIRERELEALALRLKTSEDESSGYRARLEQQDGELEHKKQALTLLEQRLARTETALALEREASARFQSEIQQLRNMMAGSGLRRFKAPIRWLKKLIRKSR